MRKINPYYNPAELGLQIVAQFDQDNLSYEFNQLVFWRARRWRRNMD